MLNRLHRTAESIRRIFRILVLFAVLRLILGVAIILLFDREAVAWGYEATLVVVASSVVCMAVGLSVKRWSPRRGIGP